MTSPSVAAALIVRNEERCLARALASLRPWVDEIIVVDTGSSDATVRIAREHGARVAFFDWCDDFAAARNAALDLADADWSLIIDADEWIETGGENLRRLTAGGSAYVGLADVRSTLEVEGRRVDAVVTSERLLPRGVRYAGRVHEQPVHSLPVRRVGLTLGHDGYEPAPAAAKRGRNVSLIRRELADRPGDPYLTYQLGKELAALGSHSDAGDAFERARRHVPADAPWRHPLVVGSLSALTTAGRLEEAVQLVDDELPSWPESPDLHFMMGNLFLELSLATPGAASDLLPMIEASWLRCLEIGDRPDLAGSVAGRGSHFAAHNLGAFYSSLGDDEVAARYFALAGSCAAPSAGSQACPGNPLNPGSPGR